MWEGLSGGCRAGLTLKIWRHARDREHCRGEPGSSLSDGYVPGSAKAEGSSIVDELGEG